MESVPDSVVDQYGIVDCGLQTLLAGESARACNLIEKLVIGEAPSNFSIVGRYVLPPTVMKLLKISTRGGGMGGEIQLTDALLALLGPTQMHALMMHGYSFDCGNKLGFLQARIALGLQDAAITSDLVSFFAVLLDDCSHRQAPP